MDLDSMKYSHYDTCCGFKPPHCYVVLFLVTFTFYITVLSYVCTGISPHRSHCLVRFLTSISFYRTISFDLLYRSKDFELEKLRS